MGRIMSGYPGGACPGNQGQYQATGPSGHGYPHGGQPQNTYPLNAPPGSGYNSNPPAQNGPSGTPGGGFPARGVYQHQPQVDPNVSRWFGAVDIDRSGQINANELRQALINGNYSHFSEEACHMMIDMFDKDSSGTINIQEFQQLFTSIGQWKNVFQGFDKDRSGSIEVYELSQAFQQMGYRFTPKFVQNVLGKYGGRTRRLTLDNFIVACVQIKRLTDGFRMRDRTMQGQAMLQYEDFVGLAMGVHP